MTAYLPVHFCAVGLFMICLSHNVLMPLAAKYTLDELISKIRSDLTDNV